MRFILKCAFARKCARLVKEQRARFYIMRHLLQGSYYESGRQRKELNPYEQMIMDHVGPSIGQYIEQQGNFLRELNPTTSDAQLNQDISSNFPAWFKQYALYQDDELVGLQEVLELDPDVINESLADVDGGGEEIDADLLKQLDLIELDEDECILGRAAEEGREEKKEGEKDPSLYLKLYHVYGTCSLLSLTLARRITSLLDFSTTYPYFGALATQSFFSDKDLLLRKIASRVHCLLFHLQSPPTKWGLKSKDELRE
ncbi:hypothetical protein JHK86_028119 [Glycine max]|nr:hypothetical protein JHK86_028119 [Glycine max]